MHDLPPATPEAVPYAKNPETVLLSLGKQFDSVNDPSALDALTPGGKVRSRGECVYTGNLDVLFGNAGLLQKPLIGFPKVNVVPA